MLIVYCIKTLIMKKMLFIAALFCAAMMLPFEASAQFDLGKALGGLLGTTSQPAEQQISPYDTLKENAPAKSKIMGTWQYKSAKVEYLGSNPLAGVALDQFEAVGIAELQKMGIVEGCCSLTLRRNGLAVVATRDSIMEANFTYDEMSAAVVATATDQGRSYKANGYVKFIGERLVVMLDARDVANGLVKAYPELATDQTFVTVKTLLDSFGDVYLSVMFER